MKPILWAALLCLIGLPALAQEPVAPPPQVSVVALDTPRASDGALVVITHHNRLTFGGLGEETLVFDTAHGSLTLRLITTANAPCDPDCPDVLEVWEAPPGLVPVPPAIETPERGVGQIILVKWEGM